jgi:hypothetical protein
VNDSVEIFLALIRLALLVFGTVSFVRSFVSWHQERWKAAFNQLLTYTGCFGASKFLGDVVNNADRAMILLAVAVVLFAFGYFLVKPANPINRGRA